MIIKEYFYNIQCDCCKALGNDELWLVDPEEAKASALDDGGFMRLDGKDYCPECWTYDDDDNIVTKDGRKFDGETYKEIK